MEKALDSALINQVKEKTPVNIKTSVTINKTVSSMVTGPSAITRIRSFIEN
jgi:hypothetical protein